MAEKKLTPKQRQELHQIAIDRTIKEYGVHETMLINARGKDNTIMIGAQLSWMRNNWKRLQDTVSCKCFLDFVYDKFGYKKSQACNLICIAEMFCTKDENGYPTGIVRQEYSAYTASQLVEIRMLTLEQRGKVTPDMAVRDIKRLRIPIAERTTSQQVYDIAVKLPRKQQKLLLETATELLNAVS